LGVHRAEHSLDIEASPADCFDALVDYESFPRWQVAVQEIEVLDRHPDGLGRDVRVHVDAKFRHVTYTLRYSYTRPGRIAWDYVEGDVEHVEGEFRLAPLDDGERTRATYALGIDPGFPAPALLVRRLNGAVMKRSVEDLKREVERRAALTAARR
jgi:ribosome-associated toxin RatA of RatAB toxin-antitoxin module